MGACKFLSFYFHPTPSCPGDAFGHQDAGNAPGPGPSEGEFAKALRQAGFPEVESKVAPQTIVNKVLTGIQKRVLKMQEFLDKFKGCQDMPLVAKSLCFNIFFQPMQFSKTNGKS